MNEISNTIYEAAEESGLMVDKLHLPIKVGPDAYLFYAVAKTDQCHRWGGCEERPYYALTGGDNTTIVNPQGESYQK